MLGDNAYAQYAWQKYTGRPIERRSGFGVRHIWGNPWNPDAFTAGWNLCYIAVFGQECLRRDNIRISSLKKQSAKSHGICTSGLILCVSRQNSYAIPASTSDAFSEHSQSTF